MTNKTFLVCVVISLCLSQLANGIIFFQGRTTACDTCDGPTTNSYRNIFCCGSFSKCCGPQSLDEFDRIEGRTGEGESSSKFLARLMQGIQEGRYRIVEVN